MPVNKYGVDIDSLREEMKDIERRSARGPYWTPQVEKNVVRILPGQESKLFYLKVWGHWIREKSTSFPCLNKMKGEKCFLCEEVDRLRDSGDRKKAAGLTARARYYMQLVDRKAPENGVQIFNTGVTVFTGIVALLDDEDWGPALLDLQSGYDLIIERTGEGLDTSYPSIRARKNSSPAGVELSALRDLEGVIDYYSYDEMRAAIEGGSSIDTDDGEKTSEDTGEKKTSQPKSDKPECYGKYNSEEKKCVDCAVNFDCEIDTPAS